MNSDFDQHKLTTWLLGEASTEEARAWEKRAQADPALGQWISEQKKWVEKMHRVMADQSQELHEMQRERILKMARSQDAVMKAPSPTARRSAAWWPWIAGTAALAMMGWWVGIRYPIRVDDDFLSYDQVTREIALLPSTDGGFPRDSSGAAATITAAGGSDLMSQREQMWQSQPAEFLRLVAQRVAHEPLPQASELAPAQPRSWVDSDRVPQAPLPTRVGVASWSWVKREALESSRPLLPSLVRLEEWMQNFPLREGSEQKIDSLVLRTLVIAPSQQDRPSRRVVLSLCNQGTIAKSFDWTYIAPAQSQYRLVGFHAASSRANSTGSLLAPGAWVQLMLEIAPSESIESLGCVRMKVQDQEYEYLVHDTVDQGHEAQFFSLLVDVGDHLALLKGQNSIMLTEIAEMESQISSPDRREALMILKKLLFLGKKP